MKKNSQGSAAWRGAVAAVTVTASCIFTAVPSYASALAGARGFETLRSSADGLAVTAGARGFETALSASITDGLAATAGVSEAAGMLPTDSTSITFPDGATVPAACAHDANGNVIVPSDYQATGSIISLSGDAGAQRHDVESFSLPVPAAGTDASDSAGMVPGDCGQITLTVQNTGSHTAQLRTYLKALDLTPPSQVPADYIPAGSTQAQINAILAQYIQSAELFYQEFFISSPATSGSSLGLPATSSWDLASYPWVTTTPAIFNSCPVSQTCGDAVDPLTAGQDKSGNSLVQAFSPENADGTPKLDANGNPINPFIGVLIDEQCVSLDNPAQIPLVYDFPYDADNLNTGGNTPDYTYPTVGIQAYLVMTDAPGPCPMPNLAVRVSEPVVDTVAQLVTWTVEAKNEGDDQATDVTVNLFADGARPEIWAPAINYTSGTLGAVTASSLVTYEQLITWSLGTMVAGQDETLKITIPWADAVAGGGVGAYIDSPDDDFLYPAVTARFANGTVAPPAGATFASAYDYARNHIVAVNAATWDAGERNNTSIADDTDGWSYADWPTLGTPALDNVTNLQVAVSPYTYNEGTVTWTVTARNSGTLSAYPAVVDLVVDACSPGMATTTVADDGTVVPLQGCVNPEKWIEMSSRRVSGGDSAGAIGTPTTGNLPDNQHVRWLLGLMKPGDEAVLTITIPAADVTFDGDICVTAVIFSPINPYIKKWTAAQVAILNSTWSIVLSGHTKTFPNDVDAEDLKYGPNHLQENNTNVLDDTDQWDYVGWFSDNPTNLKIAVSPATYSRGILTYTVTAKNAGPLTANPVTVDLVIDSLTTRSWDIGTPSAGSLSAVSAGKLPENNHLTWTIGYMPPAAPYSSDPGSEATLVISIPATDVTFDGDLCITGVIFSPKNPYAAKWTPAQVAILNGTTVINGVTYQNDIDAEGLKYGPNALQMNNLDVNLDVDQWDYYGWFADNPTDLQVSVSTASVSGKNVNFTVWAKNGGTQRNEGSQPVQVELAIDALTTAAWANLSVTKGSIGRVVNGVLQPEIEPGNLPENHHVYWEVGHLEPGQVEEMYISIPRADLTYDGDICVTAVVSSPLNPFTGQRGTVQVEPGQMLTAAYIAEYWPNFVPINWGWTAAQIAILHGTSVIGGVTYQNDIDAEALKYGPNALQMNNDNVNADRDQWDYYGWRPAVAPRSPLAKTGVAGPVVAIALVALAAGLQVTRKRQARTV